MCGQKSGSGIGDLGRLATRKRKNARDGKWVWRMWIRIKDGSMYDDHGTKGNTDRANLSELAMRVGER
jgi:hypothetical protein